MKTEKRWGTAEEFAIKSMAQTRASAKALRNAFGWVAELAGFESTPAEEMSYDRSPVPANARVVSTIDDELAYEQLGETDGDMRAPTGASVSFVCADTHTPISKAEHDYSLKFYGRPLSRSAQQQAKRIK